MDSELKIVAINNVRFKKPLSSKKALKKYKEIRNKEWVDELKNIFLRANPPPDLIEDGIAKRVIRLDIGSGISIKETKEG